MSQPVIVDARLDDAETAALRAIAEARPLLVRAPGSFPTSVLERLAAANEGSHEAAWALLPLRFEPTALAAASSLGSGAIGLPVAATAETLWVDGYDAVSGAMDLLDMLCSITTLRIDRLNSVVAGPGQVVASFTLSHAVVGMLASVARPAGIAGETRTRVHLTGSHGMISANLEAPSIVVEGRRPMRRRTDGGGETRLLEAMQSGGSGPTLRRAAELRATLERRMG